MHGECLSPTLFACYINELEKKINAIEEMGVTMNGQEIKLVETVMVSRKG